MVDVHRVAAGHPGSPPPLTVAVLMMDGVTVVSVTGITKTDLRAGARPAATVQVTDCSDRGAAGRQGAQGELGRHRRR